MVESSRRATRPCKRDEQGRRAIRATSRVVGSPMDMETTVDEVAAATQRMAPAASHVDSRRRRYLRRSLVSIQNDSRAYHTTYLSHRNHDLKSPRASSSRGREEVLRASKTSSPATILTLGSGRRAPRKPDAPGGETTAPGDAHSVMEDEQDERVEETNAHR
jgi:hypothetical protein